MNPIVLSIGPDGIVRCLYTERFPLAALGRLEVNRASHVEFNPSTQHWEVRLASDAARVAFSHPSRAECINWEIQTIQQSL